MSCAFLAVHAWLTVLGVLVVPNEAFHDVDLYRWWMWQGLAQGHWPVLDDPSVYPVGALAPMLLPALVTSVSTPGYALGWCVLVTVLDAVALVVLVRATGSARGGWWWTAFLLLIGPVGMGRLDGVIAPLMVVALVLATGPGRRGAAAGLATAGAWVKVAPGALLIPLAAAARRPWREVVLPAAAVCAVVVAAVGLGGGLGRIAGFAVDQGERGLQVESVAATPFVAASLVRDDVAIVLNEPLVTYEVAGPGTAVAARAADVALVLGVLAIAGLLLRARRRGAADAALLPGSLALLVVLVVANKVGSPQYLMWFVAPLAVALSATRRRERWLPAAAVTTLVAAGLTQLVFPWGYPALLGGDVWITTTLAVRNALLVVLLGVAVAGVARAGVTRAGGTGSRRRVGGRS